jgi:hypothetical protein
MGMGSLNMHVSDTVVLMFGVSSLVVFGGSYTSTKLDSPAIIHRVMNGNVWTSVCKEEGLTELVLS